VDLRLVEAGDVELDAVGEAHQRRRDPRARIARERDAIALLDEALEHRMQRPVAGVGVGDLEHDARGRQREGVQLEQEAARDAHVGGLVAGERLHADRREGLDDHARGGMFLVELLAAAQRSQQQRIAGDARPAVMDRLAGDRDPGGQGHGDGRFGAHLLHDRRGAHRPSVVGANLRRRVPHGRHGRGR